MQHTQGLIVTAFYLKSKILRRTVSYHFKYELNLIGMAFTGK